MPAVYIVASAIFEFIFGVVVGSIYAGWATPTEAASMGVFAALVLAAWRPRAAIAGTWLAAAGLSALWVLVLVQALAGRRNDGPVDEPPEPASGPLVAHAAASRGRTTRTRPSSSSLQEQIPMPREAAAVPDQEDRHFRNF